MDTIYFAGFCVFVSLIIVWGYFKDDHADFNGGQKSKKFSLKDAKASKDLEPLQEKDEPPKANLL